MKGLTISKSPFTRENKLTDHFFSKCNNPALTIKQIHSKAAYDYFSEVRSPLILNDRIPIKRREVLVIQQVKPMLDINVNDDVIRVHRFVKKDQLRVRPVHNLSTKVISLEINNRLEEYSLRRNVKDKKTLLHYNYLRKHAQTTAKTRRNKGWILLFKPNAQLDNKALICAKERTSASVIQNYKLNLVSMRKNWYKKYHKQEDNSRQLYLKNKLLKVARKRAATWERIKKTIDKPFDWVKDESVGNAFLAKSPLTNSTQYS